jgi:hypothetical protein
MNAITSKFSERGICPKMLRAFNFLMTGAFLFSVIVQYNDPDPLRWMSIYGLAALASIFSFKQQLRWQFSAVVGGVALIWAASLAPHVIGKTTFRDMFQSFHMINEVVEEAREMGGLLIVASWMAVLTLVSYRSRTPRPTCLAGDSSRQ